MEFNIFLLFGVCAIINTQFNYHIVNALLGSGVRNAFEEEFPFIVAFRRINNVNPNPSRDHICTGALITKQHVLSAAQCHDRRLVNQTIVLHGSNSLLYCTTYRILWWITFNKWADLTGRNHLFSDNDISVTKLIYEVQGNVEPALLSSVPYDDLVHEEVDLAGWGVNFRRAVSLNMLTAKTRILSIRECENHIQHLVDRIIGIHERHFCTFHDPFVLMLRGDFGGPVLHNHKIIGVNKNVLPDLGKDYNQFKVNIHTSINYYRVFLTAVTNEDFNFEN
ncbi:PREDICTED: uncharacterized protein LOC105360384 [Ceratosolen solmsi marchali]|uniref:Uncharacterized protein LOC105360384 n=1 Tax=Ceratosolen solmsi marchali TaxID=326594 RepID=A0AAJ6VLR6_9HYME|nr:PREDICTED: uncharacterized protein LOC105360384 [Ceratosolen solmsi marchali]